jgi:hypothetical protein
MISTARVHQGRPSARQIMDPGSERDVETYRECFENNSELAVELVKAIRSGTGGMLFDDPTDPGHECDYHDYEAGSICQIKGKGEQVCDPVCFQSPSHPHCSTILAPFFSLSRDIRNNSFNQQRRKPPRPPPNPLPPQALTRRASLPARIL